jgi:hypothetical protein
MGEPPAKKQRTEGGPVIPARLNRLKDRQCVLITGHGAGREKKYYVLEGSDKLMNILDDYPSDDVLPLGPMHSLCGELWQCLRENDFTQLIERHCGEITANDIHDVYLVDGTPSVGQAAIFQRKICISFAGALWKF